MQPVALSDLEKQRYARHLSLAEVGPDGQARLKAASVVVIGAGGLGSPAALYLAASGVGHLGLVDFDQVDLSNLQRQILFATSQVGSSKAQTARRELQGLNPDITVTAHELRLDGGNIAALLQPYDIVIDGTDRLETRYLINDACVLLGKSLVCAAIHRFEGQAMTYVPGKGPCYRCLFPDGEKALVPNCATAGVLGVLPGILGVIQATEAIKLILGIGKPLIGRLLLYDALDLRFQELGFRRRSDCAACGADAHIILAPDRTEPTLESIERWSPTELAARLAGPGASELVLVDVREPHEWAAGRLPGSLHIPLGSLPQRFSEIPADRKAVFICAGGVRSMAACRFAGEEGRPSVNLEGGLYAWSAQVGTPPAP